MSELITSLAEVELQDYSGCYTSCLILTQNNQLMLQQRAHDWHAFPGFISTFGGKIELGEKPIQAIVRELQEEVGAIVFAEELVPLGAYTEKVTSYQDTIFGYFWHDRGSKIIGCFEGKAVYFRTEKDVLSNSLMMDDVSWLLGLCKQKNLLPHSF